MPRFYHRPKYEQQRAEEHHQRRSEQPTDERRVTRERIQVRFDARTTGTIMADALDRWKLKFPDLVIINPHG